MSKKSQDQVKTIKMKDHFFLTAFLAIIVVPVVLFFLYEQLAGGILNGLVGYWREPKIHPDILLYAINPICLLVIYFLTYKQFTIHIKNISFIEKFVSFFIFFLVSITTIFGLFWKVFTT